MNIEWSSMDYLNFFKSSSQVQSFQNTNIILICIHTVIMIGSHKKLVWAATIGLLPLCLV